MYSQEKALSLESASESGQKFITVRQESKGKLKLRNAPGIKREGTKTQSLNFACVSATWR